MQRNLKNLTISMAADVARWVRVEAAKQGVSVSRYIAEMIKGTMQRRETYDAAMQSYFDRQPFLSGAGKEYPKREELYD